MAVLDEILAVARRIREQRYPSAQVTFAAGSFVRGEATAFSDIDLVVVFDRLPHASRESFKVEGYPVEAFVHDPETLRYFVLNVDRPSGVPSLAQMVGEGVELPAANALSDSLKAFAASVIAAGPPALDSEARQCLRYGITDLVDDLRDPRSDDEMLATATRLYESLADYCLRTHGHWSGKGKAIPRSLRRADEAFCTRFLSSFDDLFARKDAAALIQIVEDVLGPDGGFLFDGFRLDAPPHWRQRE